MSFSVSSIPLASLDSLDSLEGAPVPPRFLESTFKTLRTAYPTWTALRAYLTSVEGGQLTVSYQNEQYALICYTKGKSNLALPHVRLFRSVVWDIVDNLPISVSPPKSEDGESFPVSGNYVVAPFHDGVMVCLFYCKYTGWPVLHTRTYFGGTNTFYSKKTFGEMFADAVQGQRPPDLSPGHSITYILQHPDNRVVTPVAAPRVILVHRSIVDRDGLVSSSPVWAPGTVLPFHSRPGESATEVLGRYKGALAGPSGGPMDQGIVILSLEQTYTRYKLRTPTYNTVRRLRGNNASLEYTWLALWQSSTLHEYLKFYSEERTKANGVVQAWKTVSGEVFRYYEDVFKRHTLTMSQVPRKYKPLLFQLHEQYKTTRTPIGWAACREFMNHRDIPQMLYILHWDARFAATAAAVPAAAPVAALSASAAASVPSLLVLATNPPLATATATATEDEEDEEDEDYSDMPGLIPIEAGFPLPPASLAPPVRVESGPVDY
jgi:hypothetical protein